MESQYSTSTYEYNRHTTIGKWRYHLDALETLGFNEEEASITHVLLLQEMLLEQRIGGIAINDWSVIKVIQSHAEETK